MGTEPLIVEQSYKATVERVWKAITEPEEMKSWYFNIPEFRPVPGFEFQFLSGPDENSQYLHLCKVTEVVTGEKLAYTWRYEGYEGSTLVSFELFDDNGQTRVKLTHEGLFTFPEDNPDFKRESFEGGWNWLIGSALKLHVEKHDKQRSGID